MSILLISTFFVSFTTMAAPAAAPAELRARTVFGDRDVRFLAKNDNGNATIEMLADGKSRSRKLKEKEWNFLVEEFHKLPVAKNIPSECDRARMDIVLANGKNNQAKASCFGLKTITSDKYILFAQYLAQAFPN